MKKYIILILLSIFFSFEVEEKLSITELKDEAQIFILNKSYVDAISNYEKIYDIQSLIFGSQHKNLSETLIVLGDLYYKIDDELNTLRCFQEAIHIMHYNSLMSNQLLITPFEYLYEIYLSNDQLEISEHISNHLSYLYSLDTLSYNNTNWTEVLKTKVKPIQIDAEISFGNDSIFVITPMDYIDTALVHIINTKFDQAIISLSNAFVEGYDIFDYNFYNDLVNSLNDQELNQLQDFFQTSKYSDNQDIQAAAYFYLSIISYKLGNNNLSLSYINEFLRIMPDDLIGYTIAANNYYVEQNYIDALSEYQKILWANPENELALFQQGVCFYKLKYNNEAQLNFDKVLDINPDHYNSTYYLALIEYESTNFQKAIPLFLDLLQYDSKNYELYNFLGHSYYETNNLKLALSAYKKSVNLNAYDTKIYYQIGLIYEKLLNTDEAIKNYNQAINMDNNNNNLIYRLGMILYQDGQFKKSLEYLRRHLSYEPKDIEVIKILADILYSLNRLPEAIDNYKRLIELDQNNMIFYKKIASAYWELGNYNQAQFYYNVILEYDEFQNGEFYYYLGFIANQNQEYNLAHNYFVSATECGYSNILLYNQLSYSLLQMKKYTELIPILHEGLYYNPDNYDLLYNLAFSYYHLELYDEAVNIFKQYFIKNNNDLTAAYLMGVSYFKIKQYKSALYYLDLANNNSDSEILHYLGASFYELEKYSKAIRSFKKSLIINPKNEYTIYALGQAYIESDNKRDAKRQLKALMNLNQDLFELLKVSFDAKFED